MKQEDTKDRLYQSAKKLFHEKGFHQTTLKDISTTAEANPALIAYYFGNKTGLGREILDEYFSHAKMLTAHRLKQIDPSAELYLQTAVDVRVSTQMFSLYPKLLRFYLELNESSFYLENDLVSLGFFENMNRAYRLGYDRNFLRIGAITNYAVANALSTARANGAMNCSDEYIVVSIVKHIGTILGFPQEKTDDMIEASKPLATQINLCMGEGFRLSLKTKSN
ncbi:MAG: TetR/AcrR family transcriptional regulator [Eubacteriaceae bacterium]|jgi:AcrR family transcriptional regulator|nr:TetR/AcrR family transcriptional regulator [Eubacteriaceae bacterium]